MESPFCPGNKRRRGMEEGQWRAVWGQGGRDGRTTINMHGLDKGVFVCMFFPAMNPLPSYSLRYSSKTSQGHNLRSFIGQLSRSFCLRLCSDGVCRIIYLRRLLWKRFPPPVPEVPSLFGFSVRKLFLYMRSHSPEKCQYCRNSLDSTVWFQTRVHVI